jgi:hypothetical protein
MPDIARRSLSKFTYAPIHPSPDDHSSGAVARRRRGLDKVVFAGALKARPEEIAAITKKLAGSHAVGHHVSGVVAALDAIGAATARERSRRGWVALGKVPHQDLIDAGRALAAHRRDQREQLRKQSVALVAEHAAYVRAGVKAATTSPESSPVKKASGASAVGGSGAGHPSSAASVAVPANPWKPKATDDPRFSAAALKTTFADALAWSRVQAPAKADALVAVARDVAGLRGDLTGLNVMIDWDRFCGTVVGTSDDTPDWTDDLTDGFAERMEIEPIGRLHLERIDMVPVGILRGELLHSVGLAPAETVTLIHREWSSREVSFEKVVSEEFEQSTEEGVTENTELASAVETQSTHASAFSMAATASGSYGFASASASIGYNASSGDETAKRDSRNHSIGVTRKASSRTRKEHKDTFTVKEQAGVEDQQVRTLTNPSPTEPMRIDFHQLLRTWKVDLYRYGLRLTYDIVVPAPGIDLLANVDELQRIEHQLAQPFTISVTPADITRDSWRSLAARYSADVSAPDEEVMLINNSLEYPSRTEDEAKPQRFDPLEFDVPPGYAVRLAQFQAYFTLYSSGHFDVMEDVAAPIGHNGPEVRSYIATLEFLHGRSGHLVVLMASNGVQAGHASATLEVKQSDEGWRAWQNNAWAALRKGAEEQWQALRGDLQRRRDQLSAELASWDPLTLRRMEREEIMKTTLKWIFGPAFDLMPSEVMRLYGGDPEGLATLEPASLSLEQWAQTMGLGEFIKYLHQAIEWENVLYFVYPYFWDNPRNHALKRFLKHPDSLHQAFLRGGAARVVLTVRPGYEESFTRLFEAGGIDEDIGNHPYMTIAQEIRAYADTHYPGIPGAEGPADPDAQMVEAAERGERIAQWHEYTPVSALDITVNTPLTELK